MSMNPKTKRSVARPLATRPHGKKAPRSGAGRPPPLEGDESKDPCVEMPEASMTQAKRDIDAGMVDTDMRATPGLNSALRVRLVPGPGGKPPSSDD